MSLHTNFLLLLFFYIRSTVLVAKGALIMVRQNVLENHNSTISGRNVYLDLGANWGNTLRLYKDLGGAEDAAKPWEVYAFEASPLINPYLEKFVAHLNGEGPKPLLEVPPAGSTAHLMLYAPKYGCPTSDGEKMRQCMFNIFAKPLSKLKPDPKLLDLTLARNRLATADSKPNNTRFVLVPAAVEAKEGTLNLTSVTPEQMIRGGAISNNKVSEDATDQVHKAAVPMIDLVGWLEKHFTEEDFIVAKLDVEGAEFPILQRLLHDRKLNLLDVLALECHSWIGDCGNLLPQVRGEVGVFKEEEKDYNGWDSESTPDKYYPEPPTESSMSTSEDVGTRQSMSQLSTDLMKQIGWMDLSDLN